VFFLQFRGALICIGDPWGFLEEDDFTFAGLWGLRRSLFVLRKAARVFWSMPWGFEGVHGHLGRPLGSLGKANSLPIAGPWARGSCGGIFCCFFTY
jgi:hypothetical protein